MTPIKIASILVPVDDSSCSEGAADRALALARSFGATITLLHAWYPSEDLGPVLDLASVGSGDAAVSLASYLQEGARATLARQQARLSGKGVTIHAKLVGAPPRRAVIDEAAAHDLIVMGTHGRGGIARLMMGSVAEWVVRNSPVPVLTIGEHGQPAEPKVASEPAP